MTRVSPPDEPLVCPRGNASSPTTFAPRRARCAAAALPSAPRPITMTSALGAAELIEEASEHHRRLRHEVEPHVLVGRVCARVGMPVADRDHRELLRVALLILRRGPGAREEP